MSAPADFIARWQQSGASERANYALFLTELCDLLGVERPAPATDTAALNPYTFERPVRLGEDGSTGFIDLYKQGCFVLEAKQGSDLPEPTEAETLGAPTLQRRLGTARRGTPGWQHAMQAAKGQAYRYARALDEWPPFLVVADVGYCIDLYADFSRQGKVYSPFPDQAHHRIFLGELEDEAVRERLRAVFTQPLTLDPSLRSARATRELATRLARLAASMEAAGHAPDAVAHFLMRCLFSMFAEDIGLLPEASFTLLLESYRADAALVDKGLAHFWRLMDTGGFAPELRQDVVQFNGGLFRDATALPLSEAQLGLLIEAGRADWHDVEPAIFGTLLERALDPAERHSLGAHYTPRAYVERLVVPAVAEPLREEWTAVQAAAILKESAGDEAGARDELVAFHRRLCSVRVLDPACGSGNFLYVTLEHLKRLEGEVMAAIEHYPGQTALDMSGGHTVTPEQLLGLEVNPRAAAIADVVLWIGYLQWHFRTRGHARRLDPPILREYKNIRHQDALLDADGVAPWPEADFIVGNPPFIGTSMMRQALGDAYTERLRKVYRDVPDSADFVMYWWHRAAEKVRRGEAERFGFIATNSLRQTFNRRVVQAQMDADPPLSLLFAVPDHPWVDTAEGADVRISMTVAARGTEEGRLVTVVSEKTGEYERDVEVSERRGKIAANLTVGADVAGTEALKANTDVSCPGVKLHGSGFIVSPQEASDLGLGHVDRLDKHIRPYLNGRDLTARPRGVMVIDLFGLEADVVRRRFPEVYQHVYENVKPQRDATASKSSTKDSASYAREWWLFGKTRAELRLALNGLPRYIATVETSKHRFFQFLDASILPDNRLIIVASDDAYLLGVLSSHIHVTWALSQGGTLEDRPVYTKTRCFETFPFPDATDEHKETIRRLAEELDAHRKARLAAHKGLTMTAMYNVLEKQRAGEALTAAERKVHEEGLVTVLRTLHDELDAAVARAYGWPAGLAEAEILTRLVALNRERTEEEARGLVRYLRPDYQARGEAVQGTLLAGAAAAKKASEAPMPWPDELAAQVQAVQRLLTASPVRPGSVARMFAHRKLSPSRVQQVERVLEALAVMGLATEVGGAYAA